MPCRVTDETDIKVRDKWIYCYRALDRNGQALGFMLFKRRDLAAAHSYFKQAIAANGVPDRAVIDKSSVNLASPTAVNVFLRLTELGRLVTIRQVKYLNNMLEQLSCGLQSNP